MSSFSNFFQVIYGIINPELCLLSFTKNNQYRKAFMVGVVRYETRVCLKHKFFSIFRGHQFFSIHDLSLSSFYSSSKILIENLSNREYGQTVA